MSVIVDDHDAQVQYSGEWISAGTSTEYNSTTSTSQTRGDTAKFEFVGTSVGVFGTVGEGNGATMEFSIDGSPSSSYTAPLIPSNSSLFHQVFWTSEVLPEGPHTLLITQSSAESQNGTVSLDYLLYNTTSTSGKTIFIDDADDDPRVEYSSASRWNTQFTTGSTNKFFKHTTHSRESIGSAVTFKFEGTSVSVNGPIFYGYLGEGLNLTAAIDAGSPSPIIKTNQLLAGQTIVNQQLFAASGLAPGNHVVVITSQDSHLLAIDYFLFEADSSTNTSPFVGGTSSSAPPLRTLNATDPAPPSSQRLQTGLIAAAIGGGAVGGGAVVALLIGLFIWRRKRRRNNSIEHGSIPPSSRTFAWTDQGNSGGPPSPANQMNFREVHLVDVSNPLAVRPFLQWVAETQPPPPKYHPA